MHTRPLARGIWPGLCMRPAGLRKPGLVEGINREDRSPAALPPARRKKGIHSSHRGESLEHAEILFSHLTPFGPRALPQGHRDDAARRPLRGSSRARRPPDSLSADSACYHEGPWRRGGGRYGGWGEFCPPIPQEFPPLPLHDSRGRETQREQGEALGVREASTFLRLLAARLPNRARDGAGSLRPRVGLRWLRPRPCGAAAS